MSLRIRTGRLGAVTWGVLSLAMGLQRDGQDVAAVCHQRPAKRARWAWLLKHVFRADLDTCPRWGGPMRWLEIATHPSAVARLLANHGLAPRPPPPTRPTLFGQLELPFARPINA